MRSLLTESVLPRTMRKDSIKGLLVEQPKLRKIDKTGEIVSSGGNSFHFGELKKNHAHPNLVTKTKTSKTNPNILEQCQNFIFDNEGSRSDRGNKSTRTSTNTRTIRIDSNFHWSVFQSKDINQLGKKLLTEYKTWGKKNYTTDRNFLGGEDPDVVEADRFSYSEVSLKRTSLAISCGYYRDESEGNFTNAYQEYDTFEYGEYDNCVLSSRVNDFIVFEECISPAVVVSVKHTDKFGITLNTDVYVEQRASMLSCDSDSDILESVNDSQGAVNSIVLNTVMNEISEFMDEIDLDSTSTSTCNDGSIYATIASGEYLASRNVSESWATSFPDSDNVFSPYTSGISGEFLSEIDTSESWSENSLNNENIHNENYEDYYFELDGSLEFLRDYLSNKEEAEKRKRWGRFVK
ncbi:hypothetical protein HK100_012346 [Physocladia obscura]|uniref:Uncharacterized protein n=1 Tax=Physocladia obscura TaxID=109957 RepID=A0AAD5XGB1_9FUNG|nr:hypothetical protein HK100_012346 [Physocladia obscura]